MSIHPARWRGRSRRTGFIQSVDRAMQVSFETDVNEGFPFEGVEDTPRLARGICWSDVVAEIERDRLAAESREAA